MIDAATIRARRRVGFIAGVVASIWAPISLAFADEPPPSPPPAAPRDPDNAARSEAESAAAVRATQDLETAVVGLRQRIEAQETSRASIQDLHRRLDALERQTTAATGVGVGDVANAAAAADLPVAADDDATVGTISEGRRFRDAGLFLRSADGFHVLQPTLRLAPRFDAAKTEVTPASGRRTEVGFALRWAQVGVDGHAHGRAFEYRLQMELAGGSAALLDAFGQLRLGGAAALRAGRFRVPYGFETSDLLDGAGLALTHLAPASAAFTLGRDVGVMLLGTAAGGRVHARLAGTAGGTKELEGSPRALGFGARVVGAPLGPLSAREGALDAADGPRIAVGVSAFGSKRATDAVARTPGGATLPTEVIRALLDRNADGRVDAARIWQIAAELRATWRRFALQAEYFDRWENFETESHQRQNGGYAQASVLLRPGLLELAARVTRTNWPHYGLPIADRDQRGARRDEQALALTSYLRGHDLKIQAEYAHMTDHDVVYDPASRALFDRAAHRLRVQAHFAF